MSSLTISGTLAGQTTTDQENDMPFAGVTISDDLEQIESVTVTFSAANGTLSQLGNGTYNAGVYTDTGSAASVSQDLEGLIFTPTQGTPGHIVTTTFTISDTDTANATVSDDTTSVIVTSGPAISGTLADQPTNDQTSTTPFSGVTITDDPNTTETVTITLSSAANGTLSQLGGGTFNAGVYTVSGTAAAVTADIDQLVFTPTQGTPGQVITTTFTISDTDNDTANATDYTTSVVVTSGPSITGSVNGQQITDQTNVMPFANVVISDDPGQIETVQVALSNAANGSLTTDGNGTYNALSGTYTDTGTASAVTADLNALVFTPTQGSPGNSVTTTFTITDTDTASISATDGNTTVDVSSGPTISGTEGGQQTTDQSTILPFAGVTIADDAGQTEIVTITLSSTANGTLTNLGSGAYNATTGVFTDSGSAQAITSDLNHLVFTPAQGTPGQSVTTTFTISDTDGPVTVSDNTTSVVVAAGPVISGTTANQAITDQTTALPFAGVSITDDPGQTETVTVSLSAAGNGVLSNLGNGTYNALTGTYTDTGSAASVTTDLDQLIFTPAQGTPGQSVTTTFTISDTDSADVTVSDPTTSVIATSGPSITGTVGGQTAVDQSTVTPFSTVIISDDAQETETLTVTLSSAANGTLTNWGNGTYDAQTGVYTDTGSASSVTADLDNLVFNPVPGTPGQAITTTFFISDVDSATASVSDDTTSVVDNAGPSITGSVADQTTTDQATVTPFSSVVITDDPDQTDTLTVTLSNPANGTLGNWGNGTYNAATGVYTDTGSASAVTTDLQGLVFTPSQGTPGENTTTVFTISDTDTAPASVSDNTTSVITASGPAISGTQADQTVSDVGTITPFAQVVITDTQGQNEVVSVTLSNAQNGTLSNLAGGNYDSVNGIYTDSGTAAQVTAALQGLVFTPTAGTPGQDATTTTFTISDTDTANIIVSAPTMTVLAESGPAISGTVADQTAKDTASIYPFAGVTIADDPGQMETLTVSFTAGNGILTTDGNGTYNGPAGQYTDTGTAAAITADLEALAFTPTQGIPGQNAVTTTFTITDIDTAGLGATDNTTSVVAESGPAITGTQAGQQTTDLAAVTPFANVTIADDINQTDTLTVTLSSPTDGTLSDSIEGTYDAATGVYTVVDSAGALTAWVLHDLVFTPAPGTPGHSAVTTTFTISDTDTAGLTATNSTTTVVTQSGPAISGASASQSVADNAIIDPFANVTLADDVSQTETVTVTLSTPANGTLANLDGGIYNATTGVYSITGSATAVTSALDALVFTPVAGTPGHSAIATTFTITTTDTAGLSATNAITSVLAQSGPTITGASSGQNITDNGTIAPFAHVTLADDVTQTETVTVTLSSAANGTLSHLGTGTYNATIGVYSVTGSASAVTTALDALVFTPEHGTPGNSAVTTTFTISDTDTVGLGATNIATSVLVQSGPAITGASAGQSFADNGTIAPLAHLTLADDVSQTETVTVTLSAAANGTLSHLGTGAYNATAGVYTVTGSASTVTADLDALVFTPVHAAPGDSALTTTFTVSAIDTAGLTATNSTTSVVAQAGPAISGTSAGQSIADTGTITPFAHVTLTDDVSQTETVTVTLSAAANGTLTNLDGGAYNVTTGVYSITGSATAVTAALDALVFKPAAGIAGQSAIATTFTISTTDTVGLTATDAITSVKAQSGPAITGASAGQSIADTATIAPFAHLTLADDASQSETVTITLSSPANGTLSNLGSGNYNATTGVYSISGGAAAVTSTLDALVFAPAHGAAGHSAVTTTFTISDTDTAGFTATNSATSVLAQSGPAITGTSAGQIVADTGTIAPFAQLTLADDVSQTETVTVTLSAAANGTLSHLGSGNYNGTTGVYTVTGSASAVTATLDALLFIPVDGTDGHSVGTTFTVSAIDTAGLTATNATTSVTAVGGPAITGTAGNQAITNGGTVKPFSALSIADAVGQTETVTLTLSTTSDGALSNPGSGNYNAETGVYTDTGSAAAITSDLAGLVFTSSQPDLTVGQTITTGFTLSVTDSLGLNTTDTTTSVVQAGTTPVNNIPDSFAGNGTSDILFENSDSGLVIYWQMQDDTVEQGVVITTATPGWNLIGTGDFTGNGTSDILFENSDSGLVIYWQMQNGALDQGVALTTASAGWNLIGTGDFLGNGVDDLLFQNSDSGLIVYWQMQNGQLAQGVALTTASYGWQFLGVGDFDGNGTDDLLFQNSQSGLLVDWQLHNGQLTGGVALTTVSSGWQYIGIGDFTGNGTDDILFQNENSGLVVDWQMSNGALQGGVVLGTMPTGYQVVATGNYSGTATSDILLHNASTGSYEEWKVVNGSVTQTVQLASAPSDWKLMS